MMKTLAITFAFFAVVYGLSVPKSQLVIAQGFEYVGNVEGKLFVKAVLSEEEFYGVTWQRAVEICADAGYKMASITSKAQDDLIESYVPVGDVTRWMWIDGSNFASKSPDQWISLNTGKNLTFFNWVSGRPVQESTERRCLRWSRNPFDAGWWDVTCYDTHNVLCEAPIV